MSESPGRNDPCHCGSGKKYKKCCYKKDSSKIKTARLLSGEAKPERIGEIMKEKIFEQYSKPGMWELPAFKSHDEQAAESIAEKAPEQEKSEK